MQQCTLMPEAPQSREQSFGDLQTHLRDLMTRLEDQQRKGISGRAPLLPLLLLALVLTLSVKMRGQVAWFHLNDPDPSVHVKVKWFSGAVTVVMESQEISVGRMPCGIIQSNVLLKRVLP